MPIKLNVGSEFNEDDARKAKREADRYFERQAAELTVKSKLDESAARAAAQDMERRFTVAGRDAGTGFSRDFERGVRNIDASASANAIQREFADAGRDAGTAFSRNFERQADPRIDARSSSASAGGDAGNSFAGGFAGAGGLSKLAGKGGPIATAIIGGALAGLAVVKPQIEAAMNLEVSKDLTAARLGLDPATMKNVADASAKAFAGNWGQSIQANLDTATAAIQARLLSATADPATIEKMITQLTDVSTLLGEDMPNVARSASQAIRTGIAGDATQAFDLMVTAQQAGLNTSQDLLDTINEYSTQFRKIGLTGPEAFGLLTQAVRGGARDTDVAADALKEFSIRVVDGSKTTTDAFTTLNLNADEMARRFAAGGRTSAAAFDQVVDKIRGIKDPVRAVSNCGAAVRNSGRRLGWSAVEIRLVHRCEGIRRGGGR